MKLLALDSAMAACSVAVLDDSQALPLAKAWVAMERGHAEAIAPMVRDVMSGAGVSFAGLDRIVVTTGPGTFTGVRIGLAMARGLGLALGIPVIGIDTLSAIAANETPSDGPLLVVADARRGEVYAALFGMGETIGPPSVLSAASCVGMLPMGPVTVLGSGADAIIAAGNRADLRRSRAGDLPVAAKFARFGVKAPAPSEMPAPLYLRTPDAKPQDPAGGGGLSICIRIISAEGAPLLAAIHGECFDNPWSAGEFRKLLGTPGASASIAMEGDEPIGFILTRKAADEAEIISVATRPFARRRGVAKQLVGHEAQRLAAGGIAHFFLEVAKRNLAARALYAACGFAEAGNRRSYYAAADGSREDAIVMRRGLAP